MNETTQKKRMLDTRMVPAPSQGIIPERDLLSTPVAPCGPLTSSVPGILGLLKETCKRPSSSEK